MANLEKLHYKRVQSNPANLSQGYSGDVRFELKTQKNEFIKALRESYFTITFELPVALKRFNATDIDFAINNMGFVNNPVASLIDHASFTINGKGPQDITNWRQFISLYKILNSTTDDELKSQSPLLLYPGKYSTSGAGGQGPRFKSNGETPGYITTNFITAYNKATDIINSKIIVNNDLNSTFSTYENNPANIPIGSICEIAFPLSVFDTIENEDEFLGGDLDIVVNFKLSSLISTTLLFGTAIASYPITIKTMYWYIPIYESMPLKNISIKREYYNSLCEIRDHNGGSIFDIGTSNNIRRIAVCVMKKPTQNIQANIPTMDGLSNLKNIRISYNNKIYPEYPYNLDRTDTNAWSAAYKDYLLHTNSNNSGMLPLIKDFATYLSTPVFVFNTYEKIDNIHSTTLSVNLERTSTGNITDLYICVYLESVSEIEMYYNNEGYMHKIEHINK